MRHLDFGAPQALELATRLLLEEHVVVLPTDSLYGFSALAASESARHRIEVLKGTGPFRRFLALVQRFEAIEPFLHPEQEPRSLAALREVWPAALTAVLRVREALPWGDTDGPEATAAFRIPAHPRLRALLARLGRPILSTSVNRTGQEPARDARDIVATFGAEQDLTFFRDRGLEESGARWGSTLIDARYWPVRVLRQGSFDPQALLSRGEAPGPEGEPTGRSVGE